MDPVRWSEIERLVHSALARPVAERAAYVAEACGSDDALRHEVETLLASESMVEGYLSAPVLDKVAQMISDSPDSVLIGRRLGVYQMLERIGAGGMGEVYRARDSKLGREVAIKILPRLFISDPDRLARFGREARVLASLNHPHIGAIYGLEEADGIRALVLELVEGETLSDRIARGPIPTGDFLTIARQIADALDAAHEKGIIHRDLKPANIKITPDGSVKVLDFGLAKATAGDGATPDLTQSLAVTASGTREGHVLGTPAYMSPEQARGKPVDKRTDIWAFGCVIYEMLTGCSPFARESISDTIAAILEREPDWDALPAGTPTAVRRLLHRCLDKELTRRLRDIGDARMELDDASCSQGSPISTTAQISSHRPPAFWFVAVSAVLSALIAAFAAWNLKPAPAPAPGSQARFVLPMPNDVGLLMDRYGSDVTVSPDGKYVAFVGRRASTAQLYLRRIADEETTVLTDTDGAQQPFFSPDSRWLAFFADGKLKKVPITGGVPEVMGDAPGSRGGFWSENGTIVFAPLSRGSGILQVSADADGVAPKHITTLDANRGETSHRLPELLPDGNAILFVAYGDTYDHVSIVAQSLKTGERKVLIDEASQPHFASTGHLLYVQPKRPGTIMAVAFDPENLRVMGTPVPVVEGVLTIRGDYAHWSFSRSGMLVYAAGGFKEPENDLVFVDRKGNAEAVGTPAQRPYAFPRLSPDGKRVVVAQLRIQNTLWLYDLAGGSFNRVTHEGNAFWPVWTPDGKRITYASNRAGPWRLFWKPFDGSEKEQMLAEPGTGSAQIPYSWSADGKVLLYADDTPKTSKDVWALRKEDGHRQALLQTSASEVDARISPDGRWMAYASDESGRYEVWVQSVPGSGGKWQISTEGGREPVWAHSGREIFYRSGDKMMSAAVTTKPTFQPGTSRLLFQGPYVGTGTNSPNYDVTVDDQHFLMVRVSEQQSQHTDFNVVLNWTEELKRLVPVN